MQKNLALLIVLRLLQWESMLQKHLDQNQTLASQKGFEYLTKGKIDGFSSAGNTGAMFVGSLYAVKQSLVF